MDNPIGRIQQGIIGVMGNIMKGMTPWIIANPFLDQPKVMTPKESLKKESPLDSLPDELLLRILSYLSLTDLALKVWSSLGNRRLRRICQDPEICRSIIVNEMWDVDTARAVLSMVGPKLEEMTLAVKKSDLYFKWAGALEVVTKYFNLASKPTNSWQHQAHLCGGVASDSVLSTLLSIIGESGDKIILRKLKLQTEMRRGRIPKSCPFPATLLAYSSSSLRNLSSIDLYRAKFGRGNDEGWIKAIADNCVNLEQVLLPMLFSLTDDLFIYFLERVHGRLKRLALVPYMLTDDSFCALRTCQHLEILIIYYALHIGKRGLETIVELPKLQKLCISGTEELTGPGFVQALQDKAMPEMVCMEMTDMDVDDQTLEMISLSCPNLIGLFLYNGTCKGVSEVGIRSVMEKCKKMVFIYVHLISKAPPSYEGFYCYYDSEMYPNCCYCSKVVATRETRKKVRPFLRVGWVAVRKYLSSSNVKIQ